MSFEEFIEMNENDRYIAWLAFSVEVAHFKNYYYSFFLYQLNSFYIEVKVLNRNCTIITSEAFVNTDRLAPYLQQIDLTAIIEA